MAMQTWRRLPHRWIEDGGLAAFRWARGEGANNTAALMLLAVIVHHVDAETGLARLTYNSLNHLTGLSRAKISGGLTVLATRNIIERPAPDSSEIKLLNTNAPTWAKFPARSLYNTRGSVEILMNFTLRRRVELDSLKLWFLFCARRNIHSNLVNISYEKITAYCGLDRPRIRDAISFLIHHGVLVVEKVKGLADDTVSNAYRLRHIQPYVHSGTSVAIDNPTPF